MRDQYLLRHRVKADALAPLWDLDTRQSVIMGGALLAIVLSSLILFG